MDNITNMLQMSEFDKTSLDRAVLMAKGDLRQEAADELAALRAERDELLDELKWAWDNLAKSEPYPDEECEYDRCTVCRCPDWKHSETCQLKEREAVARAILAKYSGKEK